MTVGENIKQARLNTGMTQAELAERLKIKRQTLYKYEKNIVTNIPLDLVQRMADALEVSPADLMGWQYAPTTTEDYVTYPVLGEVACGYEHIAVEDWEGEKIEIPRSFLRGGKYEDYFVLKITGTSMLPDYKPNDRVLVKKQTTCDYSGQNAVIIYSGECATLKQLVYNMGEDWLEMRPTNTAQYATVRIEGADLEKCKVLGIPKVLIREL